MKARPQPLHNLVGEGGGKYVTMYTRPKIPRMSISIALWTRSLTSAIIYWRMPTVISSTERALYYSATQIL